jgi:hypothetical protein
MVVLLPLEWMITTSTSSCWIVTSSARRKVRPLVLRRVLPVALRLFPLQVLRHLQRLDPPRDLRQAQHLVLQMHPPLVPQAIPQRVQQQVLQRRQLPVPRQIPRQAQPLAPPAVLLLPQRLAQLKALRRAPRLVQLRVQPIAQHLNLLAALL